MRFLGDTREYRILSLELVVFVATLPITIPAFAVWAVGHEVFGWVERRMHFGG